MTDQLLALKLFVRVAHTGSFSRAGEDLRLSQPSTSRLIASLEREVGAALFTRSTRAVVLTEAGSDYLAKVEPALAILGEATQAIHGRGALRGVFRIGLSASMAIREVIPRLPAFISKHPACGSIWRWTTVVKTSSGVRSTSLSGPESWRIPPPL